MNSPSNIQRSTYSELIAVMTELWELLDTLTTVKPGASLRRAPSDIGIHLAQSFNSDAALAVGFTPEAVTVISALPYLHNSDPDIC